jgi:TIR domain/SIR2-like domain
MKDQLDNGDAITYDAVAGEISERLRPVYRGREFESWIRRTAGGLRPTPEGERIIVAVRRLGKVIVTTNYDFLIEGLGPQWYPYTWTDAEYKTAARGAQVVLHLRGTAHHPQSIILGRADYERLSSAEFAQIVDRSLFASHRFIFIGCGDDLNDPEMAPLIDFVNNTMPDEGAEHYILVRGRQLRQLIDRPISDLIAPVVYGDDFGELTSFLRKLAAGEKIAVSQDPEFYERRTARPRRTLLDLAGPAQEKLLDALGILRRALHAMGQVERAAVPPGMSDWDYTDQQAVHEQLAASLTEPTAYLEGCSTQVVSVFTAAEADVGRLTARTFAEYSPRLEPIRQLTSELADLSGQLLDRVKRARDDLHARTEICTDYGVPSESINRVQQLIDRAWITAVSLRDGLNGLQVNQPTVSDEASGRAVVTNGEVVGNAERTSEPPDDLHSPTISADPSVASLHLRVFLCYSSSDRPKVRTLRSKLLEDEFQPWFDEENILPGQDWDYVIRKAIRASDIALVCLSETSIKKVGYVQKEIKRVLDVADQQPEGIIFLIPVRLEQCDVPESLSRWHRVDLFDESGYPRLLRSLRSRSRN